MARAQLADRRGRHLHRRPPRRRGSDLRHLPHCSASESVAVNSEYADVIEMFRVLGELRDGSAEHERQRERIVTRCLPLADHIARRFEGRGEARDDLVQVARVGLVNAVNRFDVEAGSDFASYAVPTIMGEVRRHFRDNGWSVKVPRRLKELHLRLGAATAEMSQRLGRAPTPSELAAELDMDRDEVVEGLIAGSSYNTLSIDSGGSGDDEAPAIADTLGSPDDALDQIENREALRPLLSKLPERERTVLILRFFESMTQSQIAERVGISQMHVSRLLARSLAKLRDELQ
ncbi:RNA polymerase sigma factor SigF [Mycolicibacterium bacteremicum]|nr:RNA polymerase sigma factor SigF [Mycolicibacterium bacteremicum]